jgi:hypothetical protein
MVPPKKREHNVSHRYSALRDGRKRFIVRQHKGHSSALTLPWKKALSLIPSVPSSCSAWKPSLRKSSKSHCHCGLAIRYQIDVVFMQAAAVAMPTAMVTLWYRRSFFTPALQLKVETKERLSARD